MDPETQKRADSAAKVKPLYWIAAAALTIALVLEVMKTPNWLSIASRVALLAALVTLATAKPVETHAKKMAIYAMLAISLVLLIAKISTAP